MNIDLCCYEKIDDGQSESELLRIVDQILIEGPDWAIGRGLEWMDAHLNTNNGEEYLKYPPSTDSWGCCGERWLQYSQIVDHIEHHHYLYKRNVENNSGDALLTESPYKYRCETCDSRHFTFFAAITHFLKDHVEHRILCFQCMTLHKAECYHLHIYECNLLRRYKTVNG